MHGLELSNGPARCIRVGWQVVRATHDRRK